MNLGKKEKFSCPADDFEIVGKTIVKYKGSTPIVVVPDGIADEIGDSAFKGNTNITEVIISDKIKSIGVSAFAGCTVLCKVYIPNGIEKIHASTFSGCESLCAVNMPESITSIDDSAFHGCPISKIEFPEKLKRIGKYAFRYNNMVREIEIPAGVIEIGIEAFDHCKNLNVVKIPDTVRGIKCKFLGTAIPSDVYPEYPSQALGFYIGKHLIRVNVSNQCYIPMEYTVKEGTITICELSDKLDSITIPNSVVDISTKMEYYDCLKVVTRKSSAIFYCNPYSYAHKYAVENNISYRHYREI